MKSIEEAKSAILSAVTPTSHTESVPLLESHGRVARETVAASVPLPGFDNSAMDGFAVRAENSLGPGMRLKVVGEQPAGRDGGLTVGAGEAVRIFTGAPIPQGATAVVMQEDCRSVGEGEIEITESISPGDFLRRAGSDLCRGQSVLKPGQRINEGRIGVLASQGIAAVRVSELPRIAIVTTGDELVPPGQELEPGQLYNSNGAMLGSLARSALGNVIPLEFRHLADDLTASAATLEELRKSCDILLLTGGVSVGDHDHVKDAAFQAGFSGEFWRVRMKPGKPLFFAAATDSILFGLPGNPVSAFVTFKIFVESALWKWCGASTPCEMASKFSGILAEDFENKGDRPHFVRVRIDRNAGKIHPSGPQRSDALFGLSQADGLLCIGAHGRLNAGTEVSVQLI
ncbi:MAG: gephyrin-like molybdotransferase Glp [Verrucomicrobiota bacterium]